MTRQGLIYTFGGQIGIAVVFLILGALMFLVGLVLVFIRKNPPLTTQVDAITGVKDHGLGWWALLLACLTMGAPAVFIAVRTLVEAVDVAAGWAAAHWLVTIAVGGLAAGLGVWWLWDRLQPPEAAAPQPAPANGVLRQETTVQQQRDIGWSLPSDTPHWTDPS